MNPGLLIRGSQDHEAPLNFGPSEWLATVSGGVELAPDGHQCPTANRLDWTKNRSAALLWTITLSLIPIPGPTKGTFLATIRKHPCIFVKSIHLRNKKTVDFLRATTKDTAAFNYFFLQESHVALALEIVMLMRRKTQLKVCNSQRAKWCAFPQANVPKISVLSRLMSVLFLQMSVLVPPISVQFPPISRRDK